VLANDRIVFLDFHFFSHGSLVLGGGIEMTRTSAGNQLDFVSHLYLRVITGLMVGLNRFTTGADLGQHLFDALFVDYTQTRG
jgi:hypothetical protein